jgi:hypothetical protein
VTFNVKTRFALTLRDTVLSKPPGQRNAVTGFWVASLARVQDEQLVRIAYLPDSRFVLEADIDPAVTHLMVRDRMDEYIAHELLKRSRETSPVSMDWVKSELEKCIDRRRVVVGFRNARPIDGPIENHGQNPVWYSD